MNSKEVLIVLGSPNSPLGELSDIAISRLDHITQLYTADKQLLCTGGWGEHFNKALKAHAVYAKEYLLKKGIPEQAFLEHALSANTVDDAVKSKIILSKMNHPLITVITSDFHLERVRLIFGEVLKEFDVHYIGVKSDFLKEAQRAKLLAHEQMAIRSIIQNGLYY